MPANNSGQPAKKKGRRGRLIVILVVLLLVGGIGYGSFWTVSTVRASFPQTTGTLKLKGLSGPVDVVRDANGIPQIYADTPADLFMAQGYVQAQDRFWEMDVRRHFTAGRLSEMFGSSEVETDAFVRTLGLRRVAQQEYDTKLSQSTKQNLQAYSAGVNAYLAGHQGAALSVEYAVLGLGNSYRPEPWTPVDSVSWLKAMAWDLRSNMQDEIDRALMTTRLSTDQINQLYPEYPYDRNQPILDGTIATNPVTGAKEFKATDQTGGGTPGAALQYSGTQLSALSKTIDGMPALLGPAGNGIGSNSWVVSGRYTTTGKPLLANDPHLAPEMPSIWYQMGLHCRTVSPACPYDVTGFTFSGMPGVIIGHNQKIAWGMTNMGADVTDLYLEKVTSPTTYLYDGRQVQFQTRQETIKVAGGRPRTITIRDTNNGPLISDRSDQITAVGQDAPVPDPAPDRKDGYGVALRWSALDPGNTMDSVFELDQATDWEQFRNAARDFDVPAQNLVYADTAGNIGYQAPGQIPIRSKGFDGRYPAPGWDPAARWTRYIPFAQLPYEYNPPRGYIVTANQAVVGKQYPYEMTADWGYGTRSQRIISLIQSKIQNGGKISMDDMQSMQMDNYSEIGHLLVPWLLKVNINDPYVRQAQQLLRGWDYNQDADSAAAAYFNAVWRNVLKLAFGNKLPKEVRPKGQCLLVAPVDGSGPVDSLGRPKLVTECGERDPQDAQPDGSDRWFEVVRQILNQPNSPWWNVSTTDTAHPTDRDQLLAKAMTDARYELTAKLGKDINTWSWGRLHRMELRNQTLGADGPAIVKWLLNRGPWQMSGGEAAVDATGWNAAAGTYDVEWVPSMRMVVNLQDFDKSRWINLTGASGHAYDPHYDDQTNLWVNGQLLPWAYSSGAVAAATKDKLVLTP